MNQIERAQQYVDTVMAALFPAPAKAPDNVTRELPAAVLALAQKLMMEEPQLPAEAPLQPQPVPQPPQPLPNPLQPPQIPPQVGDAGAVQHTVTLPFVPVGYTNEGVPVPPPALKQPSTQDPSMVADGLSLTPPPLSTDVSKVPAMPQMPEVNEPGQKQVIGEDV